MLKFILLPFFSLAIRQYPAYFYFTPCFAPTLASIGLPGVFKEKSINSNTLDLKINIGFTGKNDNPGIPSRGNTEIDSDNGLPNKQKHFINTDTLIIPTGNALLPEGKVVISNGIEGIEFTPFSAQYNGCLVQPVNRLNNTGVSTSFYLQDTSSWTFYTNATQRMMIQGDGKIVTSSPLLINNAETDNESALRVNGRARFDTSINIRAASDTNSFISFDRNIQNELNPDDGISPYTITNTSWANGSNIPGLRIRHPNNVSGQDLPNISVRKDFKILPYEYGMAIEYNGVVECWVGEWSIHKGNYYVDVEGKGNGWGGVLWVGDDLDAGGVRATARNNLALGGNKLYGELSVESFSNGPHGDFRLRLPSTQDAFQFVYGERGSENVVAKISNNGIFLPKVPSADSLQNPQQSQLLFDSTDSQFKGYNGKRWLTLNENELITGTAAQSGNGASLDFMITHGLGASPSYFNVLATSPGAANIGYVTADNNYLIIHYAIPPVAGSGNLSWNWQVRK